MTLQTLPSLPQRPGLRLYFGPVRDKRLISSIILPLFSMTTGVDDFA